jgi:proliferating cell nuclear antigen
MQASFGAKTIKGIVDILKDLTSSALLTYNRRGMRIEGMDSSHIAMVLMELDSISSFKAEGAGVCMLPVDALQKVLKLAQPLYLVSIVIPATGEKMTITIEDPGRKVMKFDLKLGVVDQETLGVPQLDYDVEATMPSPLLKTIVHDMADLGDTVKMSLLAGNGLRFSVVGDFGTGDSVVPHGCADLVVEGKTEAVICQSFGSKLFMKFVRTTLGDRTTVSMKDSAPLCVRYKLDEGVVRFFLAPKLEAEGGETEL